MTKSSLAERVSSLQFADCKPAVRDSSALSRPHRLSVVYGGHNDAGERTGAVASPGSIGEVVSHPTVEISPPNGVTRRSLTGHGLTAESVDYTGQDTVIFRFRAPQHLLVAYEQGERTSGETFVEGAPSSRLRNLARRLTFVPAGHEYREQCESRTDRRITFFHFDPTLLPAASDTRADDTLGPRLLFEDLALWHAVMRLKGLLDDVSSADRRYFEAFGIVIVHELVRSGRGVPAARPPLRGGLAGWQQRAVTAYIEEHFAERIPLATLARLVRLSPWHLCRAFKQSFGMPPHRYQIARRIEHAKRLLANRELSVTEVGLQVGFASLSAFATAFGKATGFSPRAYTRSL